MNVGSKRREEWESDEDSLMLLSIWKHRGLSDRKIAEKMHIDLSTLKEWKKISVPIMTALATSVEDLCDRIEGAMAKAAIGYTAEETKTVILGDVRKGSKVVENQQTVKVEKVGKHIPGNTAAQIFMLTNLRGEKWTNKQRVDNNIEGSLNANLNLGESVQIILPDNGRDGVGDDGADEEKEQQ